MKPIDGYYPADALGERLSRLITNDDPERPARFTRPTKVIPKTWGPGQAGPDEPFVAVLVGDGGGSAAFLDLIDGRTVVVGPGFWIVVDDLNRVAGLSATAFALNFVVAEHGTADPPTGVVFVAIAVRRDNGVMVETRIAIPDPVAAIDRPSVGTAIGAAALVAADLAVEVRRAFLLEGRT